MNQVLGCDISSPKDSLHCSFLKALRSDAQPQKQEKSPAENAVRANVKRIKDVMEFRNSAYHLVA